MRAKKQKQKKVEPDLLYKSPVVTRMINLMMQGGKKSKAESIIYGALERISEDRKEAVSIFEDAVKNVMPDQEVRSRRVGGATYQVPMPVKHYRAEALALRWLLHATRSNRRGRTSEESLHEEIMNAKEGQGSAIRKKEETHRMAEANRAFAHFRF